MFRLKEMEVAAWDGSSSESSVAQAFAPSPSRPPFVHRGLIFLLFHQLTHLSIVLLFPPPFWCLAYFSADSKPSQASESWAASGQTPKTRTSSEGHESPIWELIKNCGEK